jgi:carboxyl-terminal processing protease
MTLNDAVKRMRGKPKTPLKLTIVRKGEAKPLEIVIMRDKIKVQSVKSKMIEPGFGYLRITQFQEETVPDVAKHLDKLFRAAAEAKTSDKDKPGSLRGVVLDLRNDPGGLLHSAIGVSAAFLPAKSLVVSTDGRTDDARRKYLASTEDYQRGQKDDVLKTLPAGAKTIPLVVLVNGGSASASEIVAGALQDHQRAVIMGTQTFGKGSVQTILPLPNNTAIKLTTARYYTPSGRSIQAKGIAPDVVVEESANGEARERIREADLERHLDNDKEQLPKEDKAAKPHGKAPNGKGKGGADEEEVPKAPAFEVAGKNDYQLTQAVNLLKAWQIIKR